MSTLADRPVALQLCPFAPALEEGLGGMFEVVSWFAMNAADRTQFLSARAEEVVAIATGGHVGCPPELMEQLPSLGIVSINGVGFDKVDLATATSRGIRVTTTPDVLTTDVADLAVGLTIDLLRGIAPADRFVRQGRWEGSEWPLADRVSGKRFGIVGLGRIGTATAHRLSAFGPVRYYARKARDVPYGFAPDLVELATWADVLLVTCSANAATRNLIDSGVLRALGPGGYLINVSRGSVVDEDALSTALQQGALRGAALDVFQDEPRVPMALRESERVLLTPHIASATVQCRQEMAAVVLANLRAFLAGDPLPTAIT